MGNVSKAKVNHPQIYHKKGIHHQNMGGLWHRITNINVVVHVPQSFGQIYGKSTWLLPLKLCGDLQAGRGPQHVCHIQWVAVSLRLPRRPSLADLEVPMGFWWWAARATVPLLKWLGIYIYIYIYTYIYTYTYIYIYIYHIDDGRREDGPRWAASQQLQCHHCRSVQKGLVPVIPGNLNVAAALPLFGLGDPPTTQQLLDWIRISHPDDPKNQRKTLGFFIPLHALVGTF